MALIPEVIDKLKDEIKDTFEAVHDKVKEVFGDLATDESPVILADIFHGTFIKAPATSYYTNVMFNFFAWVTYDINVNDNVATFKNRKYIGHSNETTWWTEAHIEEFKEGFNSANEYISKDDADGKIIVRISNDSVISEYYNNTWYNARIKAHWGNADSYYHQHTSSGLIFKNNQAEYTIDANDIVTCNINRSLIETAEYLYGLKGYPIVGNCNDTTYVNNFISNQGAANNYTHTYTTPQGKNINVYYGDNYVLTHVENNEPVTYKDLENAFNIAVNKINEDNDTDISVPQYKDFEPSPIESDNQEDGGNYNHAEFTKVYACTSAELNDLYQWMGGGAAGSSGDSPVTVPDNFDPMNRIVGLMGYPMIIDAGVGDETTFTFRNAANQTINTGWSTYKYANFDRALDFGTVTIPNWEELENEAPFLDYSATVEIYIPFCGIVGLDPQAVMGCTLSCKMWIDFVTGDCSAVVYTNYGGEGSQHPVAFVSGNCGSAEVVSANAFGSYQGAKAQASHKMSQAILGGFKDLATSVIGGATTGFTRGAANPSGTGGNAGMRAGAIGSVIGGAMNLGVNLTLQNLDNRYAVQVAKNALGTTISGSFGQQTSWYYMDTPYIKVTWPTPISKDVELYGKTFGVPVHRSGTLSEFTGYTVCNNVDVSGIAGATASELALIKQFLETGVFIKEGGGE